MRKPRTAPLLALLPWLGLRATLGAPVDTTPDALHAHYVESRERCTHGAAGAIIMLHDEADPHAFRRELQSNALPEHAAGNRWAYVSTRQGVDACRRVDT